MFSISLPVADYFLVTADLSRARKYLAALEAVEEVKRTLDIREALTLAATIAYCRPFKHSMGNERQSQRLLPDDLVRDLPPGLQNLHRRLVRDRDQAWAHTDWQSHEPQIVEDELGAGVLTRNPWVPMSRDEAQQFGALIAEVDHRIALASDGESSANT